MTTASRSPAWDSLNKHRSEIVIIHLEDVYIDRRFQRVITPGSTQKIVDDFHEQGVGLPLVAVVKNGDPNSSGRPYASLDGQNRFLALREMAEEVRRGERPRVPEEIRVEAYGVGADGPLTVEEAALLFTLRNNKTLVRRSERQRIAMSSGSPELIRASEQAEAAGFTFFEDDEGNPATMPHVDTALQIVRWGDRRDRDQFLTEVLDVMGDAWGRDPGSVDPDILRAVFRIMRDNPEINTTVLSQVLSRRQPHNLVAEAKGKRPPKALNIRTYTSIRDFIKMEFNRSASSVGTLL
jgi:hypothetical protein